MTADRLVTPPARRGGLAAVVEDSWESVIVVDADGLILHVNAAFERATGFRADEVVGHHVATIHGDLDESPWADLVAHLFAGDSWTGEVVSTRRDGTKYVEEASVTPVLNAGGQIAAYVAMQRDATARRKLEVRARQGARMEALGQLASGIVHDFNNLLAAISGFGEFVQLALPEGTVARRDMDEVMRAAQSATELTRQILAFSRQQSPEPARLDLATVIDGIAGMLRRLLGDDIELVTSRGQGLGRVYADARGLEQMVVNLVVNARDAMPDGGAVRVRVEPAWAPLDGGPARELVRLRIADTGFGMSPETLARIQEPFFTTKEPGRGTGLGLTTVYSVVRAAGGSIRVASAPGQGTEFTIDFPAVAPGDELEDRTTDAIALGGSETVLLVEDDPILRSMYARHLRALGYRVASAPNADVALDLSRTGAIVADVVVSDVAMPGMHGPELVRALRRTRPGLPALLVTGLAEASRGDDREWAELRKPFTGATLAAAVRRELDAPRPQGAKPDDPRSR